MTAATSVLVVEDEDSFIDALTVGLAREGFTVSVARDGAEDLLVVVRVDRQGEELCSSLGRAQHGEVGAACGRMQQLRA